MIQKIEKKFEQIVLFLIEMMIVETTVQLFIVRQWLSSKRRQSRKERNLKSHCHLKALITRLAIALTKTGKVEDEMKLSQCSITYSYNEAFLQLPTILLKVMVHWRFFNVHLKFHRIFLSSDQKPNQFLQRKISKKVCRAHGRFFDDRPQTWARKISYCIARCVFIKV